MELYTTEDLRPIIEALNEKIGFSSNKYLNQNEVARTIWLCTRMDGEIKNGGVAQLFYNLRNGFDVNLFEIAFDRIGSKTGAAIVKSFKEYLLESKTRSDNFYNEAFFGKGMTKENHVINNELSDRYYTEANDVDKLIVAYALKNWDDKEFQYVIKDLTFSKTRNEIELVSDLNQAIETGNISSIVKIVKVLSNVNQTDEFGRIPFIHIAKIFDDDQQKKIEICEILLAAGADIHCVDEYGKTLLHELAKSRNNVDEVIHFLIDKGADPNNPVNKESVLAQAINKVDTIKALLNLGADINLRGTLNTSALGRAISKYGRWIGNKHSKDYHPKLRKTISFLLENGATFHDSGILTNNSTELSYVIEDISFLKEMLAHPASKNAPEFNINNGIWNALFEASYMGHIEALEAFIDSDVPINQRLYKANYKYKAFAGCNLLNVAKNEHIERLLIKNGISEITQQAFTVFMETRGDKSTKSIIKEHQKITSIEAAEEWSKIPFIKGETYRNIDGERVFYKEFPIYIFDKKSEAEELVKDLIRHNAVSTIV